MRAALKIDEEQINRYTPERDILKTIPITEGQLEIWVVCTLGGDQTNCSYNLGSTIRIKGPIDTLILTKCLEEIVSTHEILRATFSNDGKHLYIHPHMLADGKLYDLSGETEEVKTAFLDKLNENDKTTPYDLEKGPLFRHHLVKFSDDEYVLKLGCHHIICDGWSFGVMLQDIISLYRSYANGGNIILPKAGSYSDYAHALQEFQQTEAYRSQEQFWLNQYKDSVPALDLPTDTPRPIPRTFECNRMDHRISGRLFDNIMKLRRQNRSSTATILISAFETYLFRLTNQNTITLGMPTAGQVVTGNYRLVGHCVNVLPLMSHHDGKATFQTYLHKRKDQLIAAYENQRVTCGSLLNKLTIPREKSRVPLVPVMLTIINRPEEIDDLPGLAFEIKNDARKYDNFEITVAAAVSNSSISFEWTYNKRLFNAERIERMITQFETLLIGITECPEQEISGIALDPETKKQNDINGLDKNLNISTLVNLFAESVLKNAFSPAIRFGTKSITYEQLDKRSNQVAWCLHKRGIKQGDLVGVSIERSIEMIVAMIGILKAGAAYLPLDPQYPAKRIQYMLEDSNAKLLFQNNGVLSFEQGVDQLLITDISETDAYSADPFSSEVTGNDLAYVLYTSGSTGLPKGVMIEHRSLYNFLISLQETPGLSNEDKIVAITTISFDIAITELFLPLISGAEIHLLTTNTARNGEKLIEYIKENNITVVQATPASWQMMINSGWNDVLPIKALCGGEALTKKLARDLLQRVDEVWNAYGPTETTVYSSIKKITNFENRVTIGTPILNTQMYILDNNLNMVKTGSTGEIYIAGEGLARGYLNQTELTNEKFVSNPFSKDPTAKMYATGDLGIRTETEEIICLGRKDSQIKVRGYRIEPEEIEHTLTSISGVYDAVVIPSSDDPETTTLIAYLKVDGGLKNFVSPGRRPNKDLSSITTFNIVENKMEEIKNKLREQLPSFMIPTEFIGVDTFPTTNSGKIDRKGFPALDCPCLPEAVIAADQTLTETEAMLVDIWSQALSIKNVDINTDFFELGGNSLMAIRLISELNELTGIKLPLSILFENSTIKMLAQTIDEFEETPKDERQSPQVKFRFKSLVPIKTSGSKKPIYFVHGLGLNVMVFRTLSRYVDWEQPVYGLQGIATETGEEEDFSIEYLAKRYNDEILAFDPVGPYLIAGYSLGGVLAYEMANQLKAIGKEIKMLAILDTDIVTEYAVEKNSLKEAFKKLIFHSKFLIKYPSNVKGRIFRELKINQEANLDNQNDLQQDFYAENALLSGKYKNAYDKYVFRPSLTSIHLFRAKERGYYLPDGKFYGWKSIAKAGVYTYDIPGNHATCFTEPKVALFAQTLQTAIDNLD